MYGSTESLLNFDMRDPQPVYKEQPEDSKTSGRYDRQFMLTYLKIRILTKRIMEHYLPLVTTPCLEEAIRNSLLKTEDKINYDHNWVAKRYNEKRQAFDREVAEQLFEEDKKSSQELVDNFLTDWQRGNRKYVNFMGWLETGLCCYKEKPFLCDGSCSYGDDDDDDGGDK
jgi:hypothetical protein